MNRLHAFMVCALLTAVGVMGGYATIHTVHIGKAATRPEVATEAAIKARSARLDKWETTLKKALRNRPPALPSIPRYARAQTVAAPGPAALPRVNKSVVSTRAVTSSHAIQAASPTQRPVTPKAGPTTAPDTDASSDSGRRDTPATATSTTASAPAPASAPASTPTSPRTHESSVEAQCETLKRAAEGQGEVAKRAAEQQCEALKHVAGGGGDDHGSDD